MAYRRDPLSEMLDDAVRELLLRVYAARGEWVTTRLADPDEQQTAIARAYGIDPMGPDDARTASGKRMEVHTRWGRGLVRGLFYVHKWYGAPYGIRRKKRMQPYSRALEVEFGRRLPGGPRTPPGRVVRARVRTGGSVARRAAQRKVWTDEIFEPEGNPAGRYALREHALQE